MKKLCIVLALLALLAICLTGCGLNVPKPEVKSGEFDFSVTYEVNGKTETVSGVYICEYAGVDWALDSGYHRDWNGYVKDNAVNEDYVVGVTEDGGTIMMYFGFHPDYFMGEDVSGFMEDPEPYLVVTYPMDEFGGVEFIQEADVIEETYGAKVISYTYDAPIENTFGLFK